MCTASRAVASSVFDAHVDDAMQGVDELLGGARSAVDVGDREQRRSAARIEVEHALVALERAACAVEPLVPDATQVHEDGDAVLVGLGHVGPALEDVHEVAPVALRRVELCQSA